MSSEDIECKGCFCYGYEPKSNMICTLKPFYNNKQCPCLTCLVKTVCQCYDNECKLYYEFSNEQISDKIKEYKKKQEEKEDRREAEEM